LTTRALASPHELGIYDVESGRLLASARLSPGGRARGFFVGDGFRILDFEETEDRVFRLDISELDVAAGKLTRTGAVEALKGWVWAATDPGGSRILITEHDIRRIRLVDGRSGNLLATLAEGDATARSARFLGDGRIVIAEKADQGLALRTFSAGGELLRTLPLPDGERISLGGEPAPGRLVLGIGPFGDQTIFLVDLVSGGLSRIAEHLTPALRYLSFFGPANAAVPARLRGHEALQRVG
jgi:hypothetical protein